VYQNDDMPKEFPKVALGRAEQRVRRMHQLVRTRDLNGEQIRGELAQRVSAAVVEAFGPGSGVRYTAVEHSLSELFGLRADYALLDSFFGRMAANEQALRDDRAVGSTAARHVVALVWYALRFHDVYQENNVVTLHCRVAWGPSFGLDVFKAVDVTQHGIYGLMSWVLGRRNPGNTRELVGCHMFAELSPREQYVTFRRYSTDPQTDRVNSELRRRRRQACPKGYTWPCHHCPVGHDACPLGCRAVTLQVQQRHVDDVTDESSGERAGGADQHRPDVVDQSGA
jgi:hypothetical protein